MAFRTRTLEQKLNKGILWNDMHSLGSYTLNLNYLKNRVLKLAWVNFKHLTIIGRGWAKYGICQWRADQLFVKALWTSLILNSIGNSLFHSLQRSRAHNFIVDRFHTNNTLIYSHGLLFNVAWYKHLFWFKVQFLSIAFELFDTVNVKYQQSKYWLQLMQIIWNAMLYSQHFTFDWKLLVNVFFVRTKDHVLYSAASKLQPFSH